jgi:hypothetical protein
MKLEEFKADPADYFDSPQRVLDHPGLTAEEKREILISWKDELTQLQIATEENMPRLDAQVREKVSLRQVTAALKELEDSLVES